MTDNTQETIKGETGPCVSTQVEVTCISKKQSLNWSPEHPTLHTIELEVPYDQSSIYHKMSGGTNIELKTVNWQAAEMFHLRKKYMLTISTVQE